jgi:TolB protein
MPRLLTALGSLAALACASGDGTAPDQTTGQISVTTSLSGGLPLNPSPYELLVDGSSVGPVNPIGSTRVAQLEPGSYRIELTRLPRNCAVTDQNPRDVVVTGGDVSLVSFNISCSQAPRAGRGREIAFTSDRNVDEGFSNELYLINDDGLGLVRLTNSAQGDNHADWSPDGSSIVFFSRRGQPGEARLYSMDPDGANVVPLTSVADFARWPEWKPDGTGLLAYYIIGGDAATDGVYLLDADGSNPRRIVGGWETSWAPDGARFVVTEEERSFAIVNADGSGRQEFTTVPRHTGRAAWSPDGTKILFSGWDGAAFQVYLMNSDGTGATPLTNDPPPQGDRAPAWSPDGTRIAYVKRDAAAAPSGSEDEGRDIWVMNADGTGATQLTFGGVTNPAWRP